MDIALDTLDMAFAALFSLLRMARECELLDVVEDIEKSIAEEFLPGLAPLAAIAEGDDRAAMAKHYKSLKELLQ